MGAHQSITGLRATLVLLATAAAVVSAHAATPPVKNQAYALYLKEKSACLEGRTQQDRTTCLKEAENAYAEARRHPSTSPDPAVLERNVVERCARVKEEDRADCRRLALGQGKTSGSVEAGGVIKEITTIEPSPTPVPR